MKPHALPGDGRGPEIKLGCIADDFTGATDLASQLVRAGMRVEQVIGVPDASLAVPADVDALVVALKSRTTAPEDAVAQSLAALQWLRDAGAQQIVFKVCSTFDSTERGNIGPVAQALQAALGAGLVPVCPAFPENQRTVYQGHLFVGDALLSDSSMRDHPLTPMRDANLRRLLARQLAPRQGRPVPLGLVDHACVRQGPQAVRARLQALQADGAGFAVVDAIDTADLMTLGLAFAGWPLLVTGSGVGLGLAQNFGIAPQGRAATLPPARGGRAIVAGSCSAASNAQVADFVARGGAALAVDPLRLASGDDLVGEALAWAAPRLAAAPDQALLVHATAAADAVRAVQAQLGAAHAGALVEQTLAAIARGLVRQGVRQLLVAGGETSGACVQALDVRRLRIGAAIDPGVPWCHADSPQAGEGGLHLALKSGNFGSSDFFTKAFTQLAGQGRSVCHIERMAP